MHVNLEDVADRSFSAIFSAVLFIALVLSGCGSNSRQEKQTSTEEQRSQRAPSSIAPPVAPDHRPVLVTFGDSLTAGVVENTYPEYLQGILDANGYHYRVDNQGVSGDTTTDGLARIDNVLAEHPALVILEFGGNDGLRGIPVDATRENLAQMIARFKGAKIPTVLLGITLPPNYGPDYVKPFTAMFPELAKQYNLRLFPFLLVNVYQHPDMMQPDGIHPNGEGNKIVARDVFRFIQPMLHKP